MLLPLFTIYPIPREKRREKREKSRRRPLAEDGGAEEEGLFFITLAGTLLL